MIDNNTELGKKYAAFRDMIQKVDSTKIYKNLCDAFDPIKDDDARLSLRNHYRMFVSTFNSSIIIIFDCVACTDILLRVLQQAPTMQYSFAPFESWSLPRTARYPFAIASVYVYLISINILPQTKLPY